MSSPIRAICTTGLTLTLFALLSPATSGAQATTTKCKDGTTSAASGRGACSGHGGVDKAASKAESKTVKAHAKPAKTTVKNTAVPVAGTPVPPKPKPTPAPTKLSSPTVSPKPAIAGSGGADDKNPSGAIAQCKDGLYSHAKNRTGACSRHGGVARWM